MSIVIPLTRKSLNRSITIAPSLFRQQKIISGILLLLIVTACTPLIGPYSPTAYQNATSLKPQTLALMDKAGGTYQSHQTAIEALVVELKMAHEYVKGIPSNSISARQWDILIKADGNLFGKFIKRWKQRSTLSHIFINEFKSQISAAFDEIICLEANKKEASECAATKGN